MIVRHDALERARELGAGALVGAPFSRADIERLSNDGKMAARFLGHIDALERFLAAASGCPRMLVTADDCCAHCGAPERTFRSWLRLLAYSERQQ